MINFSINIDVDTSDVLNELMARTEDLNNVSKTKFQKVLDNSIDEIYVNLNNDFHKWEIADFDACPICIENSEYDPYDLGPGINKIGDEYPSGDTQEPAHPNCRCSMVELTPDNTSPIVVENTYNLVSLTGPQIVDKYLPHDLEEKLSEALEDSVKEVLV